jgi:hypothetical protein
MKTPKRHKPHSQPQVSKSEPPAEAKWRPSSISPNEGEPIEMQTGGEVLRGRKVNGIWLPDGQTRGVSVTAWRPVKA